MPHITGMATFATSVLIAVTTLAPVSPPAAPVQAKDPEPVVEAPAPPPAVVKHVKVFDDDEEAIRAVVLQYAPEFTAKDTHDFLGASKCESGYSQFDANGKPLYSGYGTPDVGAMQINAIHIPAATEAGFDIVNSLTDNVRFGLVLYRESGMKPWKASKVCWDKAVPGW